MIAAITSVNADRVSPGETERVEWKVTTDRLMQVEDVSTGPERDYLKALRTALAFIEYVVARYPGSTVQGFGTNSFRIRYPDGSTRYVDIERA